MTQFNFNVTPKQSVVVTTQENRIIENGQIEVKFSKTYNVGDFICYGKIINITDKTIIDLLFTLLNCRIVVPEFYHDNLGVKLVFDLYL